VENGFPWLLPSVLDPVLDLSCRLRARWTFADRGSEPGRKHAQSFASQREEFKNR
jgi:hypothetical protein